MKRILLCITTVIIACFIIGIKTQATGYSWYFKPAKQGEQPSLIPEADFIEKYNVITIGDKSQKKIYLTFDAGYENGNVEKIVDVLNEKEVTGAFFVLPQLSNKNKELLMKMKQTGHLVCNHTKSHRDMSRVYDFDSFKKELEEAEQIFKTATGYDMDKYYRPPEGRFSEENLKWAGEMGYTTVFWSLAYADWDNNKQMNPQKALDLLISRTHNGCVVLLHPTSHTNAEIIGIYIDKMRSEGYEFCSIEELKSGNMI